MAGDPEWKVVWANGDEVYVRAPDRGRALIRAGNLHGASTARMIYCELYPNRDTKGATSS